MATKKEREVEQVIIKVDENGRQISRDVQVIKKEINPDMRALQFWCHSQEDGFETKSKVEITGADGGAIKIEKDIPREALVERIKNLKDAIAEED